MLHPRVLQEQIARTTQNAHQLRCRLLCEMVDEFCPPPPVRTGPGHPVVFPDNLVMKMDLLGRLSGLRGETELLRHLERFYGWLFPQLPSQSWLWRRLAQWRLNWSACANACATNWVSRGTISASSIPCRYRCSRRGGPVGVTASP